MPSPSKFAGLFTDEKTIEDRALNLAGAQPFRAALARLLPGCDQGVVIR